MIYRMLAWAALLLAPAMMGGAAQAPWARLAGAGDRFTFVINADPHVGAERPGQKRPNPQNQRFREFIDEVNAMKPEPAFVLFNGDDFERQAAPVSTRIFTEGARRLKPLPILVAGNHDVRTFDVATIFAPVQRELNGTSATQFGFDCGQWHFVALPPQELITPENEGQYLAALERDLAVNRARPTMVFMHYHILPVGLSQLEFYTYSIMAKWRLLEVLTRHANVRYVICGHVHSGIQASLKTAWTYRGVDFVVAPSPVRPRPFGEELKPFTADGGYYMTVEIDGTRAKLVGRQLGNPGTVTYPDKFRDFSVELEPRGFKPLWDLPGNDGVRNGGFEKGLAGWMSPLRYQSDREPGYTARAADDLKAEGGKSARLEVRAKGQDWAYGEFTELYQVVHAPAGGAPVLSLKYRPDDASEGGGYAWAACLKERQTVAVLRYHWGPPMETKHPLNRVIDYLATAGEMRGEALAALGKLKNPPETSLPAEPGKWHELKADLTVDYDREHGAGAFARLGVKKVMIGIGVWCTERPDAHSAANFDGVTLK